MEQSNITSNALTSAQSIQGIAQKTKKN
jgi:hypothetical protein